MQKGKQPRHADIFRHLRREYAVKKKKYIQSTRLGINKMLLDNNEVMT